MSNDSNLLENNPVPVEPQNDQTVDYHPNSILPRLWKRGDGWLILAIFIVVYFTTQIIAGIVGLALDNNFLLTVLSLFGSAFAGIGAILFINLIRSKHSFVTLGFKTVEARWYGIAFGLGILMAARIPLLTWLSETFPILNFGLEALEDALIFDSDWQTLVIVLLISTIVPLWEEMFFRGYLHNWLRNRLGMWGAILLSSFLFGLFHIVPLQAFGAFILGIAIAWLYEKSGSLWPIIFLHAANNFIAGIASFFLT